MVCAVASELTTKHSDSGAMLDRYDGNGKEDKMANMPPVTNIFDEAQFSFEDHDERDVGQAPLAAADWSKQVAGSWPSPVASAGTASNVRSGTGDHIPIMPQLQDSVASLAGESSAEGHFRSETKGMVESFEPNAAVMSVSNT